VWKAGIPSKGKEIVVMMGSRGQKGGDEYDALSRKARRVLTLRPGAIRAAKRSFNKRMRKMARATVLRTAAAD
jgi:hypothetical protein